MRFTKIVCTLGPTSNSPEGILSLAQSGMDIARLNLSHSSLEQHREVLRRVKQLNAGGTHCIGIMLDTKGAEIRTGDVSAPIAVAKDQEVLFSFKEKTDPVRPVIRVDAEEFAKDAQEAESIIVDNGELRFQFLELLPDGSVLARSLDTGNIGSRRHVNLPGAHVSLPALMQSDWDALKMGCEEGADFAALSFIRTAEEVEEVRAFVAKHNGRMTLVTKIETVKAMKNIASIIEASDGIMVARGDLGVEMPFEKIPRVQDEIVEWCIRAGKPVIVATHMLESMIKNPMPTRAEATDVAHAAVTRTDCTMLSGETGNGKYPALAVQTMAKLLIEAETSMPLEQIASKSSGHLAALAGKAANASAIVLLPSAAALASDLSGLRLRIPVFVSAEAETLYQLRMRYGIFPLLTPVTGPADVSQALKGVLPPNTKVLIVEAADSFQEHTLA